MGEPEPDRDTPSTAFNTDFKALTSLFFGKMDAGEETKGPDGMAGVFYQKENKGREKVVQVREAGGSGRHGRTGPQESSGHCPRGTRASANAATSPMTKGSCELVSPIRS